MVKSILAFVVVQLIVAGLAWVGGYNFDQRNSDVAGVSAMSLLIGGWVAIWVQFSGLK